MSDTTSVVVVILGAALVTVAAVFVGFAISTLIEVRATARALRGSIERLTPKLEETLAGVNDVTRTAAEGAAVLSHLGEALEPLRAVGRARTLIGGLLAGLGAIVTLVRRRRGGREED